MGLDKNGWQSMPMAPSPPTPKQSFEALDADAAQAPHVLPVAVIATCPLPYLEIVLQDPTGAPLARVPCELAFSAGAGRKETTDSDGRAHFANVSADAAELALQIVEDVSEDATTYHVKVVVATDGLAAKGREHAVGKPIYYVAEGEPLD